MFLVALAQARSDDVGSAGMVAASVNGSCNEVRCGACNARRRVQLTMISAETRGPSMRKWSTCAHACCSVSLPGIDPFLRVYATFQPFAHFSVF